MSNPKSETAIVKSTLNVIFGISVQETDSDGSKLSVPKKVREVESAGLNVENRVYKMDKECINRMEMSMKQESRNLLM